MHVSNRAELSRTQTQSQNVAPSQQRKVIIKSTPSLSKEQHTAISRRLEHQATVDKVHVAVQEHKQQRDQPSISTMEVLLEGVNFPDAEVLKSDLLHSFPELAQAEISVIDGSSANFDTRFDQASEALMEQEALIEQEEPGIAEQIIRDRLQEQLLKQGIEDDQVQVQVYDDERGRQVEVHIEKHP